MGERLRGKSCLITAAGQGIGRATAIAFANEGAQVFATDINADTLDGLADSGVYCTAALDVTSPDTVHALFEKEVSFDVVFNCAGYVHHGSLLDCDEISWARSFEINVTSIYRICKAAVPGMIRQGAGSIINVSSVASSIKGVPNRCVYGTTKAAVIGLTKSIAADFVAQGLRCNAICPGTVLTPSMQARAAATGSLATFVNRQPMGRLGAPEEIASLGVYLASDESKFTTGQVHIIDGGWST